MMKKYHLLFCFFCLSLVGTFPAFGQLATVSGNILDAQTQESLPFVHIFVSNTTIGATSDEKGYFCLKNVPIGEVEIVFSSVGYEVYKVKTTVRAAQINKLNVMLKPSKQELAAVEIKDTKDKTWLKRMRQFERLFLGEAYLSYCKILNPWVIEFAEDNKSLIAYATAPIEITNTYLGYSVVFHLKNFQSDGLSYLIEGSAYFIEMNDAKKHDFWKKNRELVYLGSEKHLFKSIIGGTLAQDGFKLYTDKEGVVDVNNRSDMFYDEVGKKVVEYNASTTVKPTTTPNEYTIQFKGRTEIHYAPKKGILRFYKDFTGLVSWMEVKGNQVKANANGVVLNPTNVVYSGEMSNYRIATLLPLDYFPSQQNVPVSDKITPNFATEQVYIHTDKPYYHLGETIWLKAYMLQPIGARDTLSKVLYVELFDESKKMIQRKTLKIENATAFSEIRLPPSLPAGNYLLRAYTSYMQNFGEPHFFFKPIPILQLNEKITSQGTSATHLDSLIELLPDKKSYATREKIQLTVQTKDKNGLPLGMHLSVAVTDESQVATIDEETNILKSSTTPVSAPVRVFYPVEQGISVKGIFKNEQGKPAKTPINVVLGKFEDLLLTESDKEGLFLLEGLSFYDSVDFAFQAKDKRNKPYGSIALINKEIPALNSWKFYRNLSITDAKTPQRILSEYELPKETILLKEVTVKDKREEKKGDEVQEKIYGKPDYIIDAETLTKNGATNLVTALRGKVPGLNIIEVMGERGQMTYKITARGNSFLLNGEPLIMIDGIPIGGFNTSQIGNSSGSMGTTAGERLAMIDVNTIDHIEVTTRVNSFYGDAGRNGVISVFTKAASIKPTQDQNTTKTIDVFKIQGFAKPTPFRSPDYDDPNIEKGVPDYRATIYWNPTIKTDEQTGTYTFSFFAADTPRKYKVVIEGMTETGSPVRLVNFIEVRR